jgi:hypothetical protein
MKDAAVIILAIYSLLNVAILFYFFVYKQDKIDEEYDKKLKEIYEMRQM